MMTMSRKKLIIELIFRDSGKFVKHVTAKLYKCKKYLAISLA